MGNTGTSADNAAMESFFAFFQNNVLNYKKWNTPQELITEIVYWVTIKYNKERKQNKLNNLTPQEYDITYF
jgi:transposase InsO family protein